MGRPKLTYQFNHLTKPVILQLSGKVIPNRIYRTALSEYSGSYDENNVTNTGKPLPRYVDLHQGKSLLLMPEPPYEKGCTNGDQSWLTEARG